MEAYTHPNKHLLPIKISNIRDFFDEETRNTNSDRFMGEVEPFIRINLKPSLYRKCLSKVFCLKEQCFSCCRILTAKEFLHLCHRPITHASRLAIYHCLDHYLCSIYRLLMIFQRNLCSVLKISSRTCIIATGKVILDLLFDQVHFLYEVIRDIDTSKNLFENAKHIIQKNGEIPWFDRLKLFTELAKYKSDQLSMKEYYKTFKGDDTYPAYLHDINIGCVELELIAIIPSLIHIFHLSIGHKTMRRSDYNTNDIELFSNNSKPRIYFDLTYRKEAKYYFDPLYYLIYNFLTKQMTALVGIHKNDSFFESYKKYKSKLLFTPKCIHDRRYIFTHIMFQKEDLPLSYVRQAFSQARYLRELQLFDNKSLKENFGYFGIAKTTDIDNELNEQANLDYSNKNFSNFQSNVEKAVAFTIHSLFSEEERKRQLHCESFPTNYKKKKSRITL